MTTVRTLASRRNAAFAAVAPAPRALWIARGLALAAAAGLWISPATAQTAAGPVGRIEGDDISVRGEVQVAHENGRSYTSLESGSQVTVRSGRARIELTGGGEIGVCGPARFSLVRAGTSLTLALDYGRVRARVVIPADLRIYTPQFTVSPIAAAGREDDISAGLEQKGKMCVRAASGAVRLEPQFGGDSMVVPEGMEATLEDGRLAGLSAAAQACGCDALDAKRAQEPLPPNAVMSVPLSPNATPAAPQNPEKKAPEPPPPSAPGEYPVWKVTMPLTFDASAPATGMPPPSPETALLFRQIYVEPTIVWRGEVAPAAPTVAKAAPAAPPAAAVVPPEKKPSFGTRVANFFRRMFGGKPKTEPAPASQPAQHN